METENISSVRIFYSYAHEDKNWLDELEKQLKDNHRHISNWHDYHIMPGALWENEIDSNLNNADIILLLISPDFKNSHYCTEIEMKRALERHHAGEAEVIPISLRSVHWEDPPFKSLQMLPRDNGGVNKPISLWKDKDDACAKVAADIYQTINCIVKKRKNLKKYMDDGNNFISVEKYQDARNAYENALRLSPKDALLYEILGKVCMRLNKYREALQAYEKALNIDENNGQLWRNKSQALLALNYIEDAQKSFLKAIKCDPQNAFLYKEYGDILVGIGQWKNALDAYDRAITLNRNYSSAYDARAELREQMAKRLLELANKDREKARDLGFNENGM